MNVFKSIKDKYIYLTSNAFSQKVGHFVDKYRLIQRGLFFGTALNAYICYYSLKQITALRKLQEYIDNRKGELEQTIEDERVQILESIKEEEKK